MKVTTSERLKELMVKEGLRQVDVLERCRPYCEKYGVRIRKGDLSQYVSGKVRPNQYRVTILAMALGVSEQYLLGYDETDTEADEWLTKFRSLPSADRAEVMAIIDYKLNRLEAHHG